MLISEFSELTGFYPPENLYRVIEESYMDYQGSKQDFCRDYLANKDGLAEAIAEKADLRAREWHDRYQTVCEDQTEMSEKYERQIKDLKKQLEKEEEWRPWESERNVTESQYRKKLASGMKMLTEEEARKHIAGEFGFEEGRIEVVSQVAREERNRHGRVRTVGFLRRDPLWASTDDNYILFGVNGWRYEMLDGALRRFEF